MVIFLGRVVTLAGMVVTLDRNGGMGLITLASRRRFEMPQRRMSMRRIKEVLRLDWIGGLSQREIARSVRMSKTGVANVVCRAKAAGLDWQRASGMTDDELEALLYPEPQGVPGGRRAAPDWEEVYRELTQHRHVTLQLLWEEYRAGATGPTYSYSRYCELYQRWKRRLNVTMRQSWRAGERLFVDYAGDTVAIVDRKTGEVREAQLFVAVLGASSYTYAEVTWSQDLGDWTGSHVRTFEYLGGVPEIVTPDNLKSGVKSPHRYDPEVNRTYHELAEHYGFAVIPARVRKPRDKAKAENGVLVVERWILARLRHRRFFSLEEANEAIWELVDQLNSKPFQKLSGSRRSWFEEVERPALKPLASRRWELARWKSAKVGPDYHVEVDGAYYSVPYGLVGERVDVRATASTVEVFLRGRRVASHARVLQKGAARTVAAHMPKSHQEQAKWTPQRVQRWATKSGPNVAKLTERIMASREHPQQGFRACLGIIRLAGRHGAARLDKACARALALGAYSYRSVASILDRGLEEKPVLQEDPAQPVVDHENVRGGEFFAEEVPSCS